MRSLIFSVLVAIGAVSTAPMAVADNDLVGWLTQPFGVDVDRRGSATEDYTISGWRLEPIASEKPHIRFSCSDRAGLVAVISPTPKKIADQGARVSTRITKTRVKIEGRKPVMANWLHVRETGIMQSRENKVSKQIFNAVITQSSIEIKLPMNQGKMVFTPAPPDIAFREFISACNLGG